MGQPVKRRFPRRTRSWRCSGTLTNSKMRRTRKRRRKSSWILQLLKKFSPTKRCARSMTRVRIPLILRMVKGVVVDIPSDREDTPSTFQVAIPLVEGSSSSTSTSKCHWTLLHRYLVVTWAMSTHSPTSNDLRAFTQISQVASFLLSNRFLTAFGQCGGRGGKINIIL